MPQNTTITLAVNDWTELTTADVTAITFCNLGPSQILVKGTVGSVKPTNDLAAIPYNPAEGESAVTLASLWPGLTGANRVWAYLPPSVPGTRVMVSHA